MNVIHSERKSYTLNFAKGEEVISGLKAFLEQEHIQAAHITGLGAASELTIAYYNLETKEYEKHTITDNVEILSLTGNVGVKENDELVIHMHGTFGKQNLSMFGGHIFSMTISGAGEIHLTAFSGQIRRAYDEDTGLTLMCGA